ncbi:hypothetical protein EJP02_326 [Escherichia phage EJP2]|nr:hypothetical protein EJP02_326 [Escherichia phage EJP2]
MISEDGKYFIFEDAKLVPKKGKFYLEYPTNKRKVFEVSESTFKMTIVNAASARASGWELPGAANNIDYLLDQLEMSEDLFSAMLFDYTEWKY